MAKITGFFTSDQLNTVGIDGPSSGECEECGLYQGCKNSKLGVFGEGKKNILIINGSTSERDDNTGIPMSGESGIFLRDKLIPRGINLDSDCWRINAVACHSSKKIKRKHIKCCRPKVMKVVEELKPLHIWLLGDDAISSFFMDKESGNATKFRAFCIPDPEHKAWIVSLYSPTFLIKNENDQHLAATFDRDLSFAVRCSKFSDIPEAVNPSKHVSILKEYDDVIRELETILRVIPDKLAFDYETTGLKPYREGHKIVTISFCYDYDKAYSFPFEYRNHFNNNQLANIEDLWVEILENSNIKKIIANSKYEDMWSRQILNVDMGKIWWCTMNTAHILDNRSDISGLKFQAFIRWGIPDYSKSIEKYLHGDKTSPYNKIMGAPLNDLLLYNGIDSLLTFRLQEEQEEELRPFRNMQKAREFFMESLFTLCDIQENGIHMNKEYYENQDKVLENRINDMKASLHKFPEAVRFERLKKRPINFASDHDLRALFFEILGLEGGKKTEGGSFSVDASVLAELNTPIAKEITKISKLEKIKGTYIAQFLREIEDGNKMHPFFDLHVPVTYRGSSSNPNFQNIPVRDIEAKQITREGIIPSIITKFVGSNEYPDYVGNKLIDWDYGAMEVRIIACCTQDPELMKYIYNPKTDMHRDQAKALFQFSDKHWENIPKKESKDLRFEGKNGFVFAEFYGSYYAACARNLFAKCMDMICYDGITVFEHLRSVGVIQSKAGAYKDFEAHVKKVEERFWHKFKEVKKWQESMFKFYLQHGYIEQKFGFRCQGWLSRNDICNYLIQGPAFHCLLWSINHINRKMKELQLYSKMNGQIHDCCLTDLFPYEQELLMDLSTQIATKDIREANSWINVPLLIEWEETEVNKGWSTKTEIKEN